jgi:hypothetical protein
MDSRSIELRFEDRDTSSSYSLRQVSERDTASMSSNRQVSYRDTPSLYSLRQGSIRDGSSLYNTRQVLNSDNSSLKDTRHILGPDASSLYRTQDAPDPDSFRRSGTPPAIQIDEPERDQGFFVPGIHDGSEILPSDNEVADYRNINTSLGDACRYSNHAVRLIDSMIQASHVRQYHASYPISFLTDLESTSRSLILLMETIQ